MKNWGKQRKEAGDSQETIHSISINSTRTSVNRPKQILAALNSRIWKLAGDIGKTKTTNCKLDTAIDSIKQVETTIKKERKKEG